MCNDVQKCVSVEAPSFAIFDVRWLREWIANRQHFRTSWSPRVQRTSTNTVLPDMGGGVGRPPPGLLLVLI